jgi:hypothetical protein
MSVGRYVIRTMYWNPSDDSVVTGQLVSDEELPDLLSAVLELSGGRGHPAVELARADGSSLTIATDGTRCALVWINSLEESFHSAGGTPGPMLIFDYFGSWSEVPAEFTIAVGDALECARRFIRTGAPDSHSVLFGPD